MTERPVKVYADEPSIDGVRLGDSESRVRQLWGEPERTVADMTADLASNAERGHRYLRYPGGRMAVLHDGRVVVVDGQELTSGSAHSVPAEQVRSEQEKTGALVFTRLSGDAYARLEYSIKDGRIMLVSLSPTTFD